MHITFVRAFLPQLDSRMNKYVRALKEQGDTVTFVGWDRGQTNVPALEDEVFLYRKAAALGARWRNLLALLGWNLFIIRTLFRQRHQLSAVHAVDLDSALAAWIFCRLCSKPLVFDIYDHYADTRAIGGPARMLFNGIERFLARHADLTLLADESRYQQHSLAPASNIMVVENVPASQLLARPLDPLEPGPIRIGYLGVLEERHRGLENLLDACAGRTDVELHFGGYGPLSARIEAVARNHDNIIVHGPLSHEAGLNMLSGMHCTVGFYYLSMPNHRYAAPNKYYEHLLLGRPLLTTLGTPPGTRVTKEQTGWALAETADAISNWLDNVTKAELASRGVQARALWDQHYRQYAHDVYSSQYRSRLEALIQHA
ncbi:hypothetical protein NUK34_08485 [Kerstersia gyiorum]|uniref:glycosyltransferase n=1 Tax=Kerstersia gyiorum TaxID=206506 RepID=UPI0021505C56|nr:glycosyltransferase [Kerstersia gyiorum]MCR4158888.1 hypothetical protein [Kerstersia gyiorum]